MDCQSIFCFLLYISYNILWPCWALYNKLFSKNLAHFKNTHTFFFEWQYIIISSNKLPHHLAVLKLTGFFLFCWGVDLWPEAVEEQGVGLVRSGTVDMDSNADVQWSSSSRQVSVKIIQPMLQFLLYTQICWYVKVSYSEHA